MATSFIHRGNFGFWANDGFVEAMQLCIIDEIENSGYEPSEFWLNAYKSELALQAIPLIFGGMSMELEEFIIDENRESTLISIINRILEKIDANSAYLTGNNMHQFRQNAMEVLRRNGQIESEEEFQDFVSKSNWRDSPIEKVKNNYRQAFELLKKLLMNNITSTPSSPIDYWNYA